VLREIRGVVDHAPLHTRAVSGGRREEHIGGADEKGGGGRGGHMEGAGVE
jgi:hypothetical protein